MTARRLASLLLAVGSIPGPVPAACEDLAQRVVELAPTGCRPAAIALDEQVAGTAVWWLRGYVLSVAAANPGVILRGRVLRARRFEIPQTLGDWSADGDEEEFFYPSSDPGLCEAFAGVEEALFLTEPHCCDLIPPPNVACLLAIEELRPVPGHLRARVYPDDAGAGRP